MLIQHDITIFTIYSHEKEYEKKLDWLKRYGVRAREIKNGYEFCLNETTERLFYEDFGYCGSKFRF